MQLLDEPNASKIFPKDALVRAREYLDAIGSTGAYTESQGAAIFRDQIAKVPIRSSLLFRRSGCSSSTPKSPKVPTASFMILPMPGCRGTQFEAALMRSFIEPETNVAAASMR